GGKRNRLVASDKPDRNGAVGRSPFAMQQFTESKDPVPGLISVVIVNYNRCDDLREALSSVQRQGYRPVEIIVVDNNSRDGSRAMLAAEFPDVTVVALNENIGMDGYSVGFRRAMGEFVFQMDNDSLLPDANVLGQIVRRFREGQQDLAVVAARVEEYRPEEHEVAVLRAKDSRTGPLDDGGFHSGGVAFRNELLRKVGYYNRDVFLYCSELFLQMKFLAAGLRVFFYPEILVLHKSSGVARSTRGLYFELRNRYWFMRRFATSGQLVRYVPVMILHDVIYAMHKRAPVTFISAFYEGFFKRPDSLKGRLVSPEPGFTSKVNELGNQFGLPATFRRIRASLGGV
ncbi:MAG TPA: glycosyltransferase, partial [Blastocatellia bacterium]